MSQSSVAPLTKRVAPRVLSAERLWSIGVLAVAIAVLGTVAVRFGVDGNYDLRNYHFYAGWALLHKPFGFDLAPAQVQSYQHPLVDTLFYVASRMLNHYPRALPWVWAIPQAIVTWMCFHIARRCLSSRGVAREALAAIAALIGGTGAISLGVAGTSMSEAIPTAFVMAAIWLALPDGPERPTWRRLIVAGACAGTAAMLKLTLGVYLLAFGPALLAERLWRPNRRLIAPLLGFGAGAVLAAIVVGGPWYILVWRAFGNPFFPYVNGIFRSPDWLPQNFFDVHYGPRTALDWLAFPLEWALRKSRQVSEYPVRDVRFLAGLIAALLLIAMAGWQRVRQGSARAPAAAWCAVFVWGAYLAWLKEFAVLRYGYGIESLSGVLIVAALEALFRQRDRRAAPVLASLLAAVLLIATTVVPTWDRRRGQLAQFVSVAMPVIPPDSTVVILIPAPASYLAAFEPPSVRFIGTNNSLVQNGWHIRMHDRIERALASAPGPLYGIDKLDDFFGEPPHALRRYGLRQTADCHVILSNLDANYRMCRLERVQQN